MSKQQHPRYRLKVDVTKEKSIRPGDSEENRMLRTIGERLNPDGHELLGSFSVHIYQHKFSFNKAFIVQRIAGENGANPDAISANMACQTLAEDIAKAYGFEPSKKARSLIKER